MLAYGVSFLFIFLFILSNDSHFSYPKLDSISLSTHKYFFAAHPFICLLEAFNVIGMTALSISAQLDYTNLLSTF